MQSQRQDEILDAATALFATRGFRRTTLGAIAGRLGLGKTAIYHYFDGKQAIFAASVERISDDVLQTMQEAAARESDPIDALCAAIRARFHTLRALSERLGISDAIVAELAQVASGTRGAFYAAETELFEGLLRQAQDSGAGSIEACTETAAILSGMFRGIEGMLTEPAQIGASLETLEVAIALLERGLRATGSKGTP